MTINIGLKYSEGVLLLADGRATIDSGYICSDDDLKLTKVWDNVSIASAGTILELNKFTDLVYFAHIADSHFKELLKQNSFLKIKGGRMADISVGYGTSVQDNPFNLTFGKEIYHFKDQIIPEGAFRVYSMDSLNQGKTLFDIESVAKRVYEITEVEQISALVGGIDRNGPVLVDISFGGINKKDYAVGGSGGGFIQGYLEDYHEKVPGFQQALELAVFCGVKSSKKSWAVNTNFSVMNIKREGDKISSKLVPKGKLERITKAYLKRDGTFEPLTL